MDLLFQQFSAKFSNIYGRSVYTKLYEKVEHSNALQKLCGISTIRGVPLSANDFMASALSIPYIAFKFDNKYQIMGALIELKIWNERINRFHFLLDEHRLHILAERIAARWLN